MKESFKIAGKAAVRADDPSASAAPLIATIIFGIWWWMAGVPVDDQEDTS